MLLIRSVSWAFGFYTLFLGANAFAVESKPARSSFLSRAVTRPAIWCSNWTTGSWPCCCPWAYAACHQLGSLAAGSELPAAWFVGHRFCRCLASPLIFHNYSPAGHGRNRQLRGMAHSSWFLASYRILPGFVLGWSIGRVEHLHCLHFLCVKW